MQYLIRIISGGKSIIKTKKNTENKLNIISNVESFPLILSLLFINLLV